MLLSLILSLASPSFAQKIRDVTAPVTVVRGADEIQPDPLPFTLLGGDTVRTGARGSCELEFPAGSRMLVRPGTTFKIDLQEEKVSIGLTQGRIKAWVLGALKRKFNVSTPSAVAAVRGTEFDVAHDGDTLVEVYDGLIAVQDLLGNEMLVASGERLKVQPGRPLDRPERMEGRIFQDPKTEIRREVALGMSKDEIQAAAALEARLAEYQEGKTLVDISGHRVRLEEYIVRPAADQFKLVVLNERDDRFDFFYYHGTFNQALPTDLRAALKDLGGKTGANAPSFWLVSAESGRSNTTDTVLENWAGGHIVQSTLAADKTVFHPDTDTFETVSAGSTLWENIFDNYSYKVNGTEWFGWEPNSLVPSNIAAYDYDNFRTRIAGEKIGRGTGVTQSCATDALCQTLEAQLRPATITKPDGNDALHDRVTIDYKATTSGPVLFSETFDFYVADDAGVTARNSDFSGVLSGQSYLETLLRFNFEQVITNTSFGGRKIDLVIEPKILIRSGLLE